MGTATAHAKGRTLKFFAAAESSYGTHTKPVAAGSQDPTTNTALKILSSTFDYKEGRKNRMDSRQTRSLLERIVGRKEVSWSIESYLIPSGTAGTPPDAHLFFKNAMGSYTNTPASDDFYALSSTNTDFGSLTLTRHMDNVFMEAIRGAYVEEMAVSVTGTEEAKVTFSGGAKDYAATGYSKANGAGVASATLVNRPATSAVTNFNVNSVIKVGSDDNSGAGFKITAISGENLTLEANATWSDQDDIIPFAPGETTTGSPLWGLTGHLQWDGTTIPIQSFNLNLKNNIKAINDEHAANSVSDYILGNRTVTGDITIRLRRDLVQYFGMRAADASTTYDIECKVGTTAGSTVVFKVQYAFLDFSAVDIPEEEEATVTIPFTGGSNSVGDGEFTISFE